MLNEAGPEIFDHSYLVIVPSGSFDPLASRTVLFNGKKIMVSLPAFAIGDRLAGLESEFLRQDKRIMQTLILINNMENISFFINTYLNGERHVFTPIHFSFNYDH